MPKIFKQPREIRVLASRFGAVGDGVTDDTAAIQAALDRTGAILDSYQSQGLSGPATCILGGGTYLISSTLTVRNGTTLRGDTNNPPYPNEFSGFGSNQNKYTGTQITCAQSFTGTEAINLEADNTSLENVILEGTNIDCGSTYTQIKIRNTAENRVSAGPWYRFTVSTPIDGPNPDFRQQAFEIWNPEIPFFQTGQYMEYQLSVIGGEGPFTFSVTANDFPDGISMDSNGLISGTATGNNTKPIETTFPEITVTDSRVSPGPRQFTRVFTCRNTYNEIFDQDANYPTADEPAFSYTLTTRYPQQANIRWKQKGLPDFLDFNELTGEITNNRAIVNGDVQIYNWKAYLYSVDISDLPGNSDEDTDKWQLLDTKAFRSEVRFADGGIRIIGGNTPTFTSGEAYTKQFHANGGYGQYTWSINDTRTTSEFGGTNATVVTSSSPYTGLTLNSTTGELTGTPTGVGENKVYLRCESTVDSGIFFEGLYFFKARNPGDVGEIITRSLPSASLGDAFSFQFNVTADSGSPYKYEAIGLPTGLSMDENTGIISGTPVGANYVDGVRIQWSCNVRNCTIRGFRSGGGIVSRGPSNVHRISGCLITICDTGIRSINQTWDSHFEDLYIFNCRTGLSFGPGTAGDTFSNSRIEFIHEWGLAAQTCHENDYSQIYFDTCGWAAVRLVDCRNNLFAGNRMFRSGRNMRGTGTKRNSLADQEYSTHMYLEDCEAITITGNIFDAGSSAEGNTLFVKDANPFDCIRPYTGIRMKNCRGMTILGNGLEGCVNRGMSADLGTFGRNEYIGFHAEGNSQSDRQFVPRDASLHHQEVYVANGNFRVWQRDTDFLIPAPTAAGITGFPVADCWICRVGGDQSVDQPVTISKGTDANFGFGTYLSLVKSAQLGGITGNQVLELSNFKSTGLKYLSNRNAVISFYAKSSESNTIRLKNNVYYDRDFSIPGARPLYSYTFNDFILTPSWKRYAVNVEYADLSEALTPGPNSSYGFIFEFPDKDADYDVQLTGVQVDFMDVSPMPSDVKGHAPTYEEEVAFCQKFYQHSKDWENGEFLRSWANNYRYDTNGVDWGPGDQTVWFETTSPVDAGRMYIPFHNPVDEIDTASAAGGDLTQFKLIATDMIDQQTNVDKFKFKQATNYISYYVANSNKNGVEIDFRAATGTPTAQSQAFAHWIFTTYTADTDGNGGYG